MNLLPGKDGISWAREEAREQRDLRLKQADDQYLPRIKKLQEERKQLITRIWNEWREASDPSD